ncbi:hypothetical protein [Sulfuricurvum sp.]
MHADKARITFLWRASLDKEDEQLKLEASFTKHVKDKPCSR